MKKTKIALVILAAVLAAGLYVYKTSVTAAAAYTIEQVQSHNAATDCWLIISSKVYDVTSYVPLHPGGAAAITSLCGTDASAAFMGKHGNSNSVNNVLAGYYIGDLAVADTSAPTVPAQLTTTTVSASQINLSWQAASDNLAVTGYKIFRDGVQIGSSASTVYSDSGLNPATTYVYKVSAYDAAENNSGQSTEVVATTFASGPDPDADAPTDSAPDSTASSTPPQNNQPDEDADDDTDEDNDNDEDEANEDSEQNCDNEAIRAARKEEKRERKIEKIIERYNQRIAELERKLQEKLERYND